MGKKSRRQFRRSFTQAGAPPGVTALDGDDSTRTGSVKALVYSPSDLVEAKLEGPQDLPHLSEQHCVQWVDIKGIGDGSILHEYCQSQNFHVLAEADAQNVGQRPKLEAYEDFQYVVFRSIALDKEQRLKWNQVSLFLRENFLLTVQEEGVDDFEAVRNRIREGRPTIRERQGDYLAVMILDVVVDGYFPILEHFGDLLDECEDRILKEHDPGVLNEIYDIRRDLSMFRRSVWPLREVLNSLYRDPGSPIQEENHLHLRDILDHVVQTLEFIESYRELASGLADAHLNLVGQKTNEVMKVLTIVSAVFIPLTFIAGIYGMNFDTSQPYNLPELGWQYGYLTFWLVNITLVVSLLALFRKLGWLGRRSK